MRRVSGDKRGKVYLVGAGPGDPKLITVRGLEAIARADAIVYDRLANPRLLRHARPDAQKVFAGKTPDKHMLKQEEINQLLVDLALAGKTVVRLKGGDPSVFGRVGEEAEALAERGIPFEIVPGVTSAIAVPAYAGIPVTHRDFASSFSIVTGHEYPNKTYATVNWDHLAQAADTIVFLMGVANAEAICERLIRGGKRPDTPAAIVRMGTWMEQATLTGTLETLPDRIRETNFEPPAVIVVGEVVRLRDKIAWFEKQPLFGTRVLVTRAQEQAGELVRLIEERGGEAVEFPVIRIRPPEDETAKKALDQAIGRLEQFDWVIFTSVNGVDYWFRALAERGVDIRRLSKAKIAAVGPKTEEALKRRGIYADVVPPASFQAEGLAEALRPHVAPGQEALWPTNDLARDTLADELRQAGLRVTRATVYENAPSLECGEEVLELLQAGAIHVVTFTSSSTVVNLLGALKRLGVERPEQLLSRTEVACIGPVTARTAEDNGLRVTVLPEQATVAALVDAIAERRKFAGK